MMITVLYGGEGPEREVSLRSGAAVTSAFAERGRDVTGADLRRKEDLFALLDEGNVEFAFIALHGGWGEDGTLQAALEMAGVPFSGSGHAACALAMDKTASKALFRWKGISVPKGIEVARGSGARDVLDDPRFHPLLERSGKLVVKPCCSGSTVGVSILSGTDRLAEALEDAFRYDPRVLVEEYVSGRELTVTVYEKEGVPRCLPVIEIQPVTGFYDYSSKYTPGASEYLVPAPLSEFVLRRVEAASLAAHAALGCAAYSRVDLRLDEEGFPSVLEVNTVPGMTATSLVPKAAAAAGISFGEFLEEVVESSLAARRG
ncbi:MAG TPA: D-alanine--D-alanine ligase [Synergistales bacterium]|nr:D-alanine--D-alanine ligase [Synergistales bacterium]HRV97535.1 D-alanine--D-alanine ligase [Aminobacteriaceae bacterium]